VNTQVRGSANLSTGESTQAQATEEPPPAATAAPPPAATAPATPPPANVCPVSCYVAAGASRIDVSEAELQQLRAGLAPVLGRMQQCVAPESWRRYGSPILNLRVAPDGTVGEIGVDPHHNHDEMRCFESAAAQGVPSVALPGRTTVRCVERCETPRPAGKPRRKG
jgi:hypothetical protein